MKGLSIEQQVNDAGFALPEAPEPVGNYKGIMISGHFAYFSGQLPIIDGTIIYKGKIGVDLSINDGYKATELCALNTLSQMKKYEHLHTFHKIIRIDGYINCTEDFMEHATVLNGASDLFSSVLGTNAGHVRSVFGCSSLPLGAAVEIVVIVEISK